MRVIPGNGPGDDRTDVESAILQLASRCVNQHTPHDVLQAAVEGISQLLDVGCLALELSAGDGALSLSAWSNGPDDLAELISARGLSLSDDALMSAAVMGATWIVQRAGAGEAPSPVLLAHPHHHSFAAAAAVPLIAAGGTLGAFVLHATRDTAFAARHMEAIAALAAILAADLGRRAQLAGNAATHARLEELLRRIDRLGADLDHKAVLERALGFLLDVTRAPCAVVWRLSGNRFVPQAQFGDSRCEKIAQAIVANADANMQIGQGPLGRAARSERVVVVKDALSDRSFVPWIEVAQRHGFRSVLDVPLLKDARATLVAELYCDAVDAFDEAAVGSIEALAPHVRNALRAALDAEALRALARDRAAAVSAAGGISRSLDESEVARSLAKVSVEALGASFGIAYVASDTALRVAGSWNAPAELSSRLNVNLTDPAFSPYPAVAAIRESRYASRPNVVNDSAWIRLGWEQLAREHGFGAVSAVPLIADGRAIGAVTLFFPQRSAPEADDATLRQIGLAGGAAIEAARRYDQAKSARNFLDRILEESNDAIVQFELSGGVVSWNKGAERIFGLRRDQALGKLFFELPIIPPERREDIREMLSRVGRGEQVHVFEVECRSPEGRRPEVLLSASPARDRYGKIVGLVAFSKDISEQKRQLDSLLRQNRNLAVIRDVVRSLSREMGIAPIAGKGLEKLLEVLDLDAGRLYLYDAAGGLLVNLAQRGFLPAGAEPVDVRSEGFAQAGPLGAAIAYRQAMLNADGVELRIEHPHFAHRSPADVSGVMTKPLTRGEEIVGAVQVFAFDERRFSGDDQTFFHAIAEELAVALSHAKLLEESSRMAITDPLTGLYNYRFAQDVLRKRLSEARRRKRPLSLVMVDVDGLQEINQGQGRDFGDQVLRHFAGVLTGSVRISDIVARYGGDEFVVLLPETQLSDAVMLAERMAARIAQTEWPGKDGEVSVTASLGVASFPDAGSQMQMLLKAADAALYRAKQAGRNRVHPRLDALPRFAG